MRNAYLKSLGRSAAVLLILAACGGQDPVSTFTANGMADAGAPSLSHGPAGKVVPFSGSLVGSPDATIPRLTCPVGQSATTPLRLTGDISHLGASSITVAACNRVTGLITNGVTVSQTGNGVITAANGDEIFYTYTGAARITTNCSFLNNGAYDMVITGGTGRFEGGSGTAVIAFTQVASSCPSTSDPARGYTEVTVTGDLSTVGSNKH